MDNQDEKFDLDLVGPGLHIGYQVDYSQVVVGAELAHARISASADGETIKLDNLLVKTRVGYDLDRFLPYVTFGTARVSFDNDSSSDGYVFGAGVDFKVAGGFTLGAEYSKQHYKEEDEVARSKANIDFNLFQLRASYHF